MSYAKIRPELIDNNVTSFDAMNIVYIELTQSNNVFCSQEERYRSGMVNSKSFVGKYLLRIKWNFELTVHF